MTTHVSSDLNGPHTHARRDARVLPKDDAFDSTLAFALEGYDFISKRCERLGSDVFQARLMLRRTICLRGEEAARLFYDPEKFVRRGAAPMRLQATLFGRGGVQALDGVQHQRRKAMFMAIVRPERVEELARQCRDEWRLAQSRWQGRERVVLFDEAQEVLFRSVCRWAGVPLDERKVRSRTAELAALIDAGGRVGPRHWRGRIQRQRAQTWSAQLIHDVRAGRLTPAQDTALEIIATHRDADGKPLDVRTAAVELLNVLRPTVAIARFITFAAVALHEHPEWRQRLRDHAAETELFVQEVRRFYPFFPCAVARVRERFTWQGCAFPKGTRVLLDLYGTNRHPKSWREPQAFRPERFRDWDESPFNFIAQGGGDHHTGHRCPGERITIEVMKESVGFLVEDVAYDVPAQDLSFRLSRMPALPRSRFIMKKVRLAPPL